MANDKSILIFILFLTSSITMSQDIPVNYFTTSPLSINPAATGTFDNDKFRLHVDYGNNKRSIVNSSFSNINASVDIPLKIKTIGIGILHNQQFLSDKSISSMNTLASVSYRTFVHEESRLFVSVGLQGGLRSASMKSSLVDPTNLYWKYYGAPNSFTSTEETKNISVPETNFGAMLYSENDSAKINPWIGISALHLLEPSVSFSDTTRDLKRKYILQAGANINISEGLAFCPNALLFNQDTSTNYSVGTTLNFISPNSVFRIGAQFHSNNGLLYMVGLDVKGVELLINFTLNSNSSRTGNKVKISESENYLGLGLRYTFREKYQLSPEEKEKIRLENFQNNEDERETY